MTTPTVGPSPALSASSKVAPNPAQASTAEFVHQLNAARQRGGPTAQDQRPAQQAPGKPDSDGDRGNKPVPPGSDPRHPDTGANRADKSRDAAAANGDTAATATSSSQAEAKAKATATVLTPPVPNTATPLVAETVADVATDAAAPGEKDPDDGEQGAAALVGAMLALVGPAAGKVLPLGAADTPATSDKPVTADAATAVMLQGGDAASMALPANGASLALPVQWLPGQGLPLDTKNLRDLTRADAASSLGLSAPTLFGPTAPMSTPTPALSSAQSFAQELGQQMAWFVDQGIQQACIRLHPDDLGSLDLKISVNHGRVDVVFQAQHPGAVTAVQQSLPQLGQMLAQHGLSLGNTEVGQHDRGNQSGRASRGDQVAEIDEIHGASVVTPLNQLGLLDAFA